MRNTRISSFFHNLKRSVYYFLVRCYSFWTRLLYANKNHTFLFILCPPYCGSTLLNSLLSSSSNVSCNNHLGTREGQLLPGVDHIMFKKDRWDENKRYPWMEIKNFWLMYWDYSKSIFLEKSIPNLMRVDEINQFFYPIKYICMVRNPYAHAEGLMRRNNFSAEKAADFVIRCLDYQRRNIENNKCLLFITYEELCDRKEDVLKKLIKFIPELSDIKIDIKFSSHNFKTNKPMGIKNLNDEKILKISKSNFKIIDAIFKERKDLLDFFNY